MGRQRGDRPDPGADPSVDKTCAVCGRAITWRRAWADSWADVRHCSRACRRGLGPDDRAVESVLRDLLVRRAAGATVCPSEAARAVATGDDPDAWRRLVEPARSAARRMVATGEAEITQGGRVVDPSTARGPIRVRRT